MKAKEIRHENIKIIGKGRGYAFKSGTKMTQSGDDYILEICEKPRECILALVSGIIKGEPNAKLPVLLFPDGTGEIALLFEEQDKDGNWNRVDLPALLL